MNKPIIIATANHPLAGQLSILEADFEIIDQVTDLDLITGSEEDIIFDFTLFPFEQKLELLGRIGKMFKGHIISDLTLNWGEAILDNIPRLSGAMGTAFYSPKNTVECWSKDDHIAKMIEMLLTHLSLKAKFVSTPGFGFIYPRTVSQIINEAYFALEENLATEESIDRAMSFGVNYPHGPFEWASKIGHQKIVALLDELYTQTKEPRYRTALSLKRAALKSTK
jgi:3-hydroxybutyryl-CoA dehydrogenase